MIRNSDLTKKDLEKIGIINIDVENKIVQRYDKKGTKVLFTVATRSL